MIAIIDYGMGNLRSIQKACQYVGFDALVTSERAKAGACDKLILPGVGAFRDAIAALHSSGLDETLKEAAQKGKQILGICLGHQLLFERSFEDGIYAGLGLIPGEVKRIQADGKKIPHMGWNTLCTAADPLFEGFKNGSEVYFVHSYAAVCEQRYILCRTDYGAEIVAGARNGNIRGLQFHPEKSGENGLAIIKNFGKL